MREILLLCNFLLIGVILAGCGTKTKLVAHRGASRLAPENTLASVNLAWELNADAVEVDVYLSKDNRIVVIHDRSTKRTAGVDFTVKETLSDELKKLDVGAFKSPDYKGEKIPFLIEVIRTVPERKKLFVEIKCGPEILPVLKEVIDGSGKKSCIVIISFDYDTVSQCKALMLDIPAYWLCGTERRKNRYVPHSADLINMVKKRNLDGLNVQYRGVTEEFVKAVKSSGLELYVWTVNSLEEAKRLRDLGVDGITTDRPGWIRDNWDN